MNGPPHDPLSLGGIHAAGIHAAGVPAQWARSYNEEVVAGAGSILWRRRWTIVWAAIAAIVLASIFLILTKKEYTAETLLRLDFNSSRADASPRIALDPGAIIESEARIMRSRAVAERVVMSENLEANPEFSAPAGIISGAVYTLKSLFGADSSIRDMGADPAAAALLSKNPGFRNAVSKIIAGTVVESDNKSYLVAIRFKWDSAETAAQIANALSEAYLRERQLQNLAEEASRLKAELSRLEQRIGDKHPTILGTRSKLASIGDQMELLRRAGEPVRNATVESFTAIAAVPALPPLAASAPKPGVVYGLTLLAVLAGISALILLLERRNGRIELEGGDLLGVRRLGIIPRPDTPDVPCIHTMLTEAVRSIAAAAALEAPGRRPTVVLVTSSVPDEDKTLFTTNLARVLSEAGRRVLVVDTVAQVRSCGDGPQSEIQSIRDIEPATYHTASLTDRLSTLWGDGLDEFLKSARKTHEVILIKGPPVLLLADSIRLARLSDTVILLARWRSTRLATVANAIRMLADAGIQVGGIVVTNVNLSKLKSWPAEGQSYYFSRYGKFYASLSS